MRTYREVVFPSHLSSLGRLQQVGVFDTQENEHGKSERHWAINLSHIEWEPK